MFVGAPAPTAGALDVAVHGNFGLAHPEAAWGLLDVVPVTAVDGSVQGVADVLDSTRSFKLSRDVARTDALSRTITAADLAGLSFEFTARSQFFLHDHQVRFLAGGEFCIDTHLEDCYLQGTYAAEDPGLSMVSFSGEADGAVYRGKAWVEFDASGAPGQLVMVGVSDTPGPMAGVGLGLVADSVD